MIHRSPIKYPLSSLLQVGLLVCALCCTGSTVSSDNTVPVGFVLCSLGEWYLYSDAEDMTKRSTVEPGRTEIRAPQLIRDRTGDPKKRQDDFIVIARVGNPKEILKRAYCFNPNDCYKPISLSEPAFSGAQEPLFSMHRMRGRAPRKAVIPFAKSFTSDLGEAMDHDRKDEYYLALYDRDTAEFGRGEQFEWNPENSITRLPPVKPGLYKITSAPFSDAESALVLLCTDEADDKECKNAQDSFLKAQGSIKQCNNADIIEEYLQAYLFHLADLFAYR